MLLFCALLRQSRARCRSLKFSRLQKPPEPRPRSPRAPAASAGAAVTAGDRPEFRFFRPCLSGWTSHQVWWIKSWLVIKQVIGFHDSSLDSRVITDDPSGCLSEENVFYITWLNDNTFSFNMGYFKAVKNRNFFGKGYKSPNDWSHLVLHYKKMPVWWLVTQVMTLTCQFTTAAINSWVFSD